MASYVLHENNYILLNSVYIQNKMLSDQSPNKKNQTATIIELCF